MKPNELEGQPIGFIGGAAEAQSFKEQHERVRASMTPDQLALSNIAQKALEDAEADIDEGIMIRKQIQEALKPGQYIVDRKQALIKTADGQLEDVGKYVYRLEAATSAVTGKYLNALKTIDSLTAELTALKESAKVKATGKRSRSRRKKDAQ